MAINNKCFLLREGSVGPGEAGAKVGMEWKPGAWYLQQGQGPRAADATAAERTSGSEDTSLVQHLVPEMRTGRCLWVPTGQSSPSQPQVLSSRGPPNHCLSGHPSSLSSPAVLLSMIQGCVLKEEELKLQQKPDRGDGQGHVSPHCKCYFHSPPCSSHSQVPD